MRSKRIITSLNQITVPADRKEAMLENIFRQADAERASLEKERKMNRNTGSNPHPSIKRRALVALVAAALLLLTACAAAVYFSTVSKLKSDASSELSRTEQERRADAQAWAEIYAGGSAPTIAIDKSAEIADVGLCVKTMELRPMENDTLEAYLAFTLESETTGAIVCFDWLAEDVRGQNTLEAYASFCEIGMDAREFALTIDGQTYAPYVQADYEGQPQPAAGFDSGGTLSMIFRNLPQIPSGTGMTLSGTLYRCDRAGNRMEAIGDFSIPFVYSFAEAERQAWLDSLTTGGIENQQAAAEAGVAALNKLPESATPIHATVEEITFLDIAAAEDGFLIGLRYDLQCESISGTQQLTYYIDGYKAASSWVDSQWETDTPTAPVAPSPAISEKPYSFTLLEQLPYYTVREKLPNTVTIACVRKAGTGTTAGDSAAKYAHPAVSFVFRYDMRTGAVTLPPNDAEKAAWLAAATPAGSQAEECRVYDMSGQSQTINGTTVSIQRIAALSTGKWMVCYKIEKVACEIAAWETLPVITVDGRQATMVSKAQTLSDERMQEVLDNYSMKKNRWTTDEWEVLPPSRLELLPELFTVEISWDLYDLNKRGERELVGAYTFQIPVNRDDCTITVDKAYLISLN